MAEPGKTPGGAREDLEGPTRVVVVDDDPGSLKILRTILEKDGCEVDCFQDPRGALARMKESPPDVLVADWVMPGMDGPDLLRALRKTPNLQGTYCVLVTAHTMETNRFSGLMLGADDYLTKPVSENELVARVRVGTRVRRLERHANLLTMAATLGHEINNPLTGVLGYLELMAHHLDEGEVEKARQALAKVQGSADRIREVVGRLLELSNPRLKRYSTGAFMLDLRPGESGTDPSEEA